MITNGNQMITIKPKKSHKKTIDKNSWYSSRMELFKKFQNGYSEVFFDHTFLEKT